MNSAHICGAKFSSGQNGDIPETGVDRVVTFLEGTAMYKQHLPFPREDKCQIEEKQRFACSSAPCHGYNWCLRRRIRRCMLGSGNKIQDPAPKLPLLICQKISPLQKSVRHTDWRNQIVRRTKIPVQSLADKGLKAVFCENFSKLIDCGFPQISFFIQLVEGIRFHDIGKGIDGFGDI